MIIIYSNANEDSIKCAIALKSQRHVVLFKNDPGVLSEYYKACHELAPDHEHVWPMVLTHETEALFGGDAVRYCGEVEK